MGVVEDPLVLKKFMGMLSKKKIPARKRDVSGGHDCKLRHFGAESNQKKTEFFLRKNASGPPMFLVGHKDSFYH